MEPSGRLAADPLLWDDFEDKVLQDVLLLFASFFCLCSCFRCFCLFSRLGVLCTLLLSLPGSTYCCLSSHVMWTIDLGSMENCLCFQRFIKKCILRFFILISITWLSVRVFESWLALPIVLCSLCILVSHNQSAHLSREFRGLPEA